MEILFPTAEIAAGGHAAARLPELRGRRLVALWNGRRPGPSREFLQGILEQLDARHGLQAWDIVQKPYLGNAAPDDLLREVVAAADGAITGLGD